MTRSRPCALRKERGPAWPRASRGLRRGPTAGRIRFPRGGQRGTALDQVCPDVVVNCVGIVKQRPAARDAYLTVAINAYLPHLLAVRCAERGCRLLHISTDCVFSGARGGYVEGDPSDAQDLYGKSKHLGETAPDETGSLTLRTSIVGRELQRPHHGLLEWFLASRGQTVRGFTRVLFTGLTTLELSRVVQRIIDHHPTLCGLFHVAGPPISKHDLLGRLRGAWDMDVEIRSDDGPVCDRSLVMGPFTAETGYTAPTWDAMIERLRHDPTPYDRWFPPDDGARERPDDRLQTRSSC
ncbi:MAG: sugar nucleotide-binding protein [Thermoanaerobaculia bacterium]